MKITKKWMLCCCNPLDFLRHNLRNRNIGPRNSDRISCKWMKVEFYARWVLLILWTRKKVVVCSILLYTFQKSSFQLKRQFPIWHIHDHITFLWKESIFGVEWIWKLLYFSNLWNSSLYSNYLHNSKHQQRTSIRIENK